MKKEALDFWELQKKLISEGVIDCGMIAVAMQKLNNIDTLILKHGEREIFDEKKEPKKTKREIIFNE